MRSVLYRYTLSRFLPFLPLIAALALTPACSTTEDATDLGEAEAAEEEKPRPMGLVSKTDGVAPGYILYSPLSSGMTYLMDTDAKVVHSWDSDYMPHSMYLLDDGSLLRPGRDPDAVGFQAGGAMGLLEQYTWEGEKTWSWKISDDSQLLHHDIEPLPNGNLLALGWEVITPEEARAAGRREDLIPEEGLWSEFLVEIEPLPPDDGRIVWKWRVWDHLIQNVNRSLPNYGNPADHPNRVDINAGGPPMEIDADQLAELQALGYVPTPEEVAAAEAVSAAKEAKEADGSDTSQEDAQEEEEERLRPDFLHINAIHWNPELNQLAMTTPELGEVWVIHYPTSTEEAAGPAGDLIYRWGNASAYGRGPDDSKRLFYPHDVQWIPEGYENAGQMTIFNNGSGRPEGSWSSVEQIVPPLRADGSYVLEDGKPYGPEETSWHYRSEDPESFFAAFISGAHRLPNGNTFITSGPEGRLFEVDMDGNTVWDLWNPLGGGLRKPNEHGSLDSSDLERRFAYAIWRARKYSPDHPGLAGRDLKPLSPQPEHFIPPPPEPEEEDGDSETDD